VVADTERQQEVVGDLPLVLLVPRRLLQRHAGRGEVAVIGHVVTVATRGTDAERRGDRGGRVGGDGVDPDRRNLGVTLVFGGELDVVDTDGEGVVAPDVLEVGTQAFGVVTRVLALVVGLLVRDRRAAGDGRVLVHRTRDERNTREDVRVQLDVGEAAAAVGGAARQVVGQVAGVLADEVLAVLLDRGRDDVQELANGATVEVIRDRRAGRVIHPRHAGQLKTL